MRSMSKLLFTFLVFNGFETSLEIKPLIGFAFNKVRDNLTFLNNFQLLSDSITDISFFCFIYLDRFLEIGDLRAGAINVLSAEVTMIVLFHDRLNQYFGLGLINLSNLHQVTTANSPHHVCRIYGVSVFLEMLLSSDNVILK